MKKEDLYGKIAKEVFSYLKKKKEKEMAITREELVDKIAEVADAVKSIDIGTERIQSMLNKKERETEVETEDGTEMLKLIVKVLIAVAVGALIAFALYNLLKPNYFSDMDDDIDDDFEDDFFADEDEITGKA